MIKKVIREPFFHFILLGALIFLLYGWLNRDAQHPEGYDITITPDQQVKMAVQYEKNFGRLPDSITMQNLIAAEIKNEIYYRESLRLGLDIDDEIIRRRLKQKYEFIQLDNFVADEPTEEVLKAYYEKHSSSYLSPSTYTFEHQYFSPDKRKDPLRTAQDYQVGIGKADPFHIPSPLSSQDIEDVRDAFGYQFAQELMSITSLEETHVIESGFGYHVVQILSKESSAPIPFEEAKGRVYQDYIQEQRNTSNEEMYDDLLGQYEVVVEEL